MQSRIVTALDLARKGYWRLILAKTLQNLGLQAVFDQMTCQIEIPGEPATRGLRLYVELGDWISDDLCRYRQWEAALSREMMAHARRGGVLVDVGANMGYFSLLWAAARESNRAHAVEASPRIFSKLTRNIQLNHLESRIQTYALALSDRVGFSAFDPGPDEQTGWGGLVDSASPGTIEVATTRLDSLFAKLLHIDVLKIDAEGGDTRVLRGAEQMLRAHRIGVIYFEQYIERMAALEIQPGDAAAFLDDCGYKVCPLPGVPLDGKNVTEWKAALH